MTGPPVSCPELRREYCHAAKRRLASFASVLSFAFRLPTFARFLPLVAASAVSKLARGNVSSHLMRRSLASSLWRKSGLSGGGAAFPAFGAVFLDALTPVLFLLFKSLSGAYDESLTSPLCVLFGVSVELAFAICRVCSIAFSRSSAISLSLTLPVSWSVSSA
jgi:hypothetical protein